MGGERVKHVVKNFQQHYRPTTVINTALSESEGERVVDQQHMLINTIYSIVDLDRPRLQFSYLKNDSNIPSGHVWFRVRVTGNKSRFTHPSLTTLALKVQQLLLAKVLKRKSGL